MNKKLQTLRPERPKNDPDVKKQFLSNLPSYLKPASNLVSAGNGLYT
ncbi:hypothetical protein [Leptospira kobayashii]|nr:hypothetical protein [Leptospira kobayashii]